MLSVSSASILEFPTHICKKKSVLMMGLVSKETLISSFKTELLIWLLKSVGEKKRHVFFFYFFFHRFWHTSSQLPFWSTGFSGFTAIASVTCSQIDRASESPPAARSSSRTMDPQLFNETSQHCQKEWAPCCQMTNFFAKAFCYTKNYEWPRERDV